MTRFVVRLSFVIGLSLLTSAGLSCRSRKSGAIDTIAWRQYQAGLAEAAAEGKRVMLYFWRPGCGWCRKMENNTYSDKNVAAEIQKYFVPIKVNGWSDEPMAAPEGEMSGRILATNYRVAGYPQIWFLESDGTPINYYPGYASIEDFKVVLGYVGEGHYKDKSLKEYAASIGRVF